MILSDEERAGLMHACGRLLNAIPVTDTLGEIHDICNVARALKALLSAQASPAIQGVDVVELERLARAATPGPWKSRGLGGDSILLAPTHRWHKPYIYPDQGHPIAVPRLYPDMDAAPNNDGSRPMRVDFSSAGFAHADAQFIAAANPQVILALLSSLTRPMVEGDVMEVEHRHVAESEIDPWARRQRKQYPFGFYAQAHKDRAFLLDYIRRSGTRSAREALSPESGGDGSGPEVAKP
jgi:hypothetical protein